MERIDTASFFNVVFVIFITQVSESSPQVSIYNQSGVIPEEHHCRWHFHLVL
jgi:hypothetical protein